MTVDGVTTPPRRRSRRDEILEIAVALFATRGYHGVSMDDIGAAAGVTGPALYHHFAGKEAMLVAALIPVSERLLAGGRERVAGHPDDPAAALAALAAPLGGTPLPPGFDDAPQREGIANAVCVRLSAGRGVAVTYARLERIGEVAAGLRRPGA